MKSSLTVYKASAGSGKTFTLAIQYIKTLIEQESRHAYSHILAVTFTNKATAEMKDRILQQLYGIWKGLPSSANYLESLQKELRADGIELPEEEIRSRAGSALCHILHDYNRFRVETIDSFFQSVLKNLAHELSLTANLKVDLNDKEVLHAAVDHIMERLHLTPTILNWILEYVDDRISNNERWDIAREVKSFAAWIFKEAYLAREHEMREVLRENKRIGEPPHRAQLRVARLFGRRAERGSQLPCRNGSVGTRLRPIQPGRHDRHLPPAHRRRQHQGRVRQHAPRLYRKCGKNAPQGRPLRGGLG